jgi:hypothetical protein
MSNADYIPGGRFTLDLPFPVSVNKTRRIDWSTRHRTASWLRAADSLVLMQKPLLKAPAAFELQLLISEKHDAIDLDNGIKILIDYLVRIEVIKGDQRKYLRRLVVEWGEAPEGCRVTVIPYVARVKPSE